MAINTEDCNEWITLASINVGQAVTEIYQTAAWLALTPNQQNRMRVCIMSIETASVRLGDANVSATRGALIPAGTTMGINKNRGNTSAYCPSGTAVVNVTLGLA